MFTAITHTSGPIGPDAATGVIAFFGAMMIFWVLFVLVSLAFWVYCLVDILENEFTGNNKIIWVIVLLGFGPLGMILYWFIGREQKIDALQPSSENLELLCELCKSPMRIRALSAGEDVGKKYYVCDAYPQCKNVRPV